MKQIFKIIAKISWLLLIAAFLLTLYGVVFDWLQGPKPNPMDTIGDPNRQLSRPGGNSNATR